jgi:phosphoglycolate phosphatase
MRRIFWDWNGTLLDDTQAALATLNEMLSKRGAPMISMEFYRDNFSFPVKPFYTRIGMVLDGENWDDVAREYHDIYAMQPKRLNEDALAALKLARNEGLGQSIISALRQDLLDADTARYAVRDFFDHVFGVDNLDGCSKMDRARELLRLCEKDDIVMIGDSLHDKEVADELGVKCILCSQGSHAHHRLAAVAPAAETLIEAVKKVLVI